MFKVGDFVKAKRKLTIEDMNDCGIHFTADRLVKLYNEGSHEVMRVDTGLDAQDIALRDDRSFLGSWWFAAAWFTKVEVPNV